MSMDRVPQPSDYAAALLEVGRETRADRTSQLAEGFLRLISADGALAQWPEILAELSQRAVLKSATVSSPSDTAAVRAALGDDVAVTVDERLIAGAVLHRGDTVVDGSIKGQLRRLVGHLRHSSS